MSPAEPLPPAFRRRQPGTRMERMFYIDLYPAWPSTVLAIWHLATRLREARPSPRSHTPAGWQQIQSIHSARPSRYLYKVPALRPEVAVEPARDGATIA